MTDKTQNELVKEWKNLRVKFFNVLNEDKTKFEKLHGNHPLYDSVTKHFDKNFKQINQIVQNEIEIFLENKNKPKGD